MLRPSHGLPEQTTGACDEPAHPALPASAPGDAVPRPVLRRALPAGRVAGLHRERRLHARPFPHHGVGLAVPPRAHQHVPALHHRRAHPDRHGARHGGARHRHGARARRRALHLDDPARHLRPRRRPDLARHPRAERFPEQLLLRSRPHRPAGELAHLPASRPPLPRRRRSRKSGGRRRSCWSSWSPAWG